MAERWTRGAGTGIGQSGALNIYSQGVLVRWGNCAMPGESR